VIIEAGTFVPLFFSAIAIGACASLLGLGGGVFMVPLLLLGGFVVTQPDAAGTSIAAVLFTGLSASTAYYRRKSIDFRIGFLFMPSAIGGVFLGSYIVQVADPAWLTVAFGVFLLYPTAMMLLGRTSKDVKTRLGSTASGWRFYVLVTFIGLVAGTATKLFGIGGGAVFVPSLVIFLGLDIVKAVAVSLFVMVPTALIGSVTSWIQGTLHVELALPLVLGIVIGAQIGPRIGSRIPKKRLRQLFGLVLLYAAVNMILKGIQSIA
jgi:uncharacterized membrane protein YfcA